MINDLIQKLKKNPSELEILRRNTDKVLLAHKRLDRSPSHRNRKIEEKGRGFQRRLRRPNSVKTIAHTVIEEMKLENAKFRFTVGAASGGG